MSDLLDLWIPDDDLDPRRDKPATGRCMSNIQKVHLCFSCKMPTKSKKCKKPCVVTGFNPVLKCGSVFSKRGENKRWKYILRNYSVPKCKKRLCDNFAEYANILCIQHVYSYMCSKCWLIREVAYLSYCSFIAKFLRSKGLYKDLRLKIIKMAMGGVLYNEKGCYHFGLCHNHSSGDSFICKAKWRLKLDYGSLYITKILCPNCENPECVNTDECSCPFCLWVFELSSSFKDIIGI